MSDTEPEDSERTPQQDGEAAVEPPTQKLRQERDELFDRLARMTADFQNTRRRLDAELDQRMQYANASLITSLLPVIDNFERALAVDPATGEVASILKGMQIVHDQWLNVFKSQDVQTIDPPPGSAMDPNVMQVIMEEKSPHPPGTVARVLQKGYSLHGRTLRPAQVALSKE
jgi:molecular chaperone GrpE